MIILDLDNCISDDRWRLPLIGETLPVERRWDAYHALCDMDRSANNPELLVKGHEVIISTSRPEACRQKTVGWLLRLNIRPHLIFMRPNGNLMRSVDLKEWNLLALPKMFDIPLSSISMAYDDRSEIVEMYKRHGVPTTQLKIHSEGENKTW